MTVKDEQTPGTALAVKAERPAYAIAPAPRGLMPQSIEEAIKFGELMFNAGSFPDLQSAKQATIKIVAGAALGYDAVTAMNAWHLIEGKLCPTAGEVGARIKRSGRYNFRPAFIDKAGKKITNLAQEVFGCAITFYELFNGKWEEIGISVFTKTDAITAGVYEKKGPRNGPGVYKTYFRNMCFSRALTNGARWYCSDVFGGPVYTAEELGANVTMGPDGEIQLLSLGDADPAAPPPDPHAGMKPPGKPEIVALYQEARKVKPDLPEDIRAWLDAGFPDLPKNDKGQTLLGSAENAWLVYDAIKNYIEPPAPVEEAPPAPVEGVVEAPEEYRSQTLERLDESLKLPITDAHRTNLIIMFRDRQYTTANRHAKCKVLVGKESLSKDKCEMTEADYLTIRQALEKIPVPGKPPAPPETDGF